ncbi:MAG: STAS domain-containing protein [Agarilytica sp.]
MEITRSQNNAYHVLIDPEFSFPSCYTTYNEIKTLLDQEYDVILDFSACTHIDSSALGGLFSLRKNFDKNTAFRIINVNPHIYKIFQIYKLDRAITIEPPK